jgi:hypothetical protein
MLEAARAGRLFSMEAAAIVIGSQAAKRNVGAKVLMMGEARRIAANTSPSLSYGRLVLAALDIYLRHSAQVFPVTFSHHVGNSSSSI